MRLFGDDPELLETRRRVGFAPDAPLFPKRLTGLEVLELHSALLGIEKRKARARALELLEQLGIAEAGRRACAGYSRGQGQRLGLAAALLGEPELLLLDEPTAGLDPAGVAAMRELLSSLRARGVAILLNSHLLSEVEKVCDVALFIKGGKLLLRHQVAGAAQTAEVKLANGAAAQARIRELVPEASLRGESAARAAGDPGGNAGAGQAARAGGRGDHRGAAGGRGAGAAVFGDRRGQELRCAPRSLGMSASPFDPAPTGPAGDPAPSAAPRNPAAARDPAAPVDSEAALASAPGAAGGSPRASSQLVSWPVALQCARAKIRGGPTLAFAALLCLSELGAGGKRSPANLFGGVSFFSQLFLLALTLALGAGLISEELESGHAQLVLLRPLSRAAFFGGRLAGAGLALLSAMGLAFLVACGSCIAQGTFSAGLLLAFPVAFVWAFSWLALLGALSSVLRGASNAVWLLIGAILWVATRFGLMGAGAIALAVHRWEWMETLSRAAGALLPYLGPQDPNALVEQLLQHATADFGPLLYDLLWIAASWTAGAFLLSRRELARRRA